MTKKSFYKNVQFMFKLFYVASVVKRYWGLYIGMQRSALGTIVKIESAHKMFNRLKYLHA